MSGVRMLPRAALLSTRASRTAAAPASGRLVNAPSCTLCARQFMSASGTPARPRIGHGITSSTQLKRALRTSSRSLAERTPDPGGKPVGPNDRTVYDDFTNITSSSAAAADDPGAGVEGPVTIKSMSPESFTLSDGLVVSQPLLLLNGQVFLWRPPALDAAKAAPNGQGWEEWLAADGGRDEIWKMVELISPKPEILLFGTGRTVLPPPRQIRAYLGSSLGIQLEVQDSRNAGSTYNMLQEEGRVVAAALLPSGGWDGVIKQKA